MKLCRDALVEDGIPLAQFAVDDLAAEHARLRPLRSSASLPRFSDDRNNFG
ncbi:hypothetical protein [Microbacterium sp. PMB16]|uniref:hypothetical protein n=1 Tax=Microbacterium sp. PMB16 TaxID=3120157 RepID=UPI003F4BD5D7